MVQFDFFYTRKKKESEQITMGVEQVMSGKLATFPSAR